MIDRHPEGVFCYLQGRVLVNGQTRRRLIFGSGRFLVHAWFERLRTLDSRNTDVNPKPQIDDFSSAMSCIGNCLVERKIGATGHAGPPCSL